MRQVIKDLTLGSKCSLPLVVISALARKTKTGKDYLQMEFFDGTDKIPGNYWDWGGINIPEKNAILNVTGQVTEWQGAKQLNISKLSTCTDYVLAEFMPASTYDVASIYKDAYELANSIKNQTLWALSTSLLQDLRLLWLEVPAAKGVHHAYIAGTLIHSYSVAKTAKAMALATEGANVDLCIAGGLLHDLGKLYTYKMNGLSVDMTSEGMLHDHIFIGANFIGNFADSLLDTNDFVVENTVRLLQHVILSHHGKLEHGSPVVPMCIEAHIVHLADTLDASAEQIRSESRKNDTAKWTEKIYTLGNRPHLTTQYVRDLLGEE